MSRTLLCVLALTGCGIENTFSAQRYTDQFLQAPVDTVDILFVVDDSYSMEAEQEALANGFDAFISELETANNEFHIGVISTSHDTDDPDRGKMIGDTPFLTTSDDYAQEFKDRVRVGINGSDKEKGLQAAGHALSPEMLLLHNIGFLRPEANLLVVVVSDEDDCSDDGFLDGRESSDCYTLRDLLTPVDQLVYRLHDSKNDGERVQVGAIIGPFDDSCADAFAGRRYAEAVFQTGGMLGKVCDQDWSTVLQTLGLNALGILTQFKLTHAADPASLEVLIDEVPILPDETNGWTYDGEHWVLRFHGTAVPERGSTVVVNYDIAPYSAEAPPPATAPTGTGSL